MHYANGRAAQAGDIVRGKGYNVKHEIIGKLIYANPGSSACNCQVAYVGESSVVRFHAFPLAQNLDGELRFGQVFPSATLAGVEASIEYGQLDAFVAIDPKTGEVLPGPTEVLPEPEPEWTDSDGADLAGAIERADREHRETFGESS